MAISSSSSSQSAQLETLMDGWLKIAFSSSSSLACLSFFFSFFSFFLCFSFSLSFFDVFCRAAKALAMLTLILMLSSDRYEIAFQITCLLLFLPSALFRFDDSSLVAALSLQPAVRSTNLVLCNLATVSRLLQDG